MNKVQKALLSTVLAVTVGITAKVNPDKLPTVLIFTCQCIERMMEDKKEVKTK